MPRGRSLLAAVVALTALAGTGAAMESTCEGCFDNCCQWAFSADNPRDTEFWERRGFKVPCADVVHDPEAYQKCVNRAFDRCSTFRCTACGTVPFGSWFSKSGRARSKPGQLYEGQVIIVETAASKARSRSKRPTEIYGRSPARANTAAGKR